jgi:cation-transporting ATPase E
MFSLAGIPGERKLITGAELDAMPGPERDRAILESNIFGRMKPDDKEYVISSLKRNGRYVAMIGDGVNDVRSIKAAQVGVSLESGSNAAKGVSDMILVGDDFSSLPKALVEGRKTVSSMRDILRLYLTRNFALALMFFIIYMALGTIPMKPIQNTFYAFISVSILAFFMILFSRPDVNKNLILPDVLKFALPSSIIIVAFGLLAYAVTWTEVGNGHVVPDFGWMASAGGFGSAEEAIEYLSWSGSGIEEICARSNLVLFVTLAGLGQIMMITPYFRFMSIDGKTNRSLVPWVILGLIALMLAVAYAFFPWVMIRIVNLVIFEPKVYAWLGVLLVVWFVVERALLRHGFLSGISSWFEKRYIRKLEREYAKEDSGDE